MLKLHFLYLPAVGPAIYLIFFARSNNNRSTVFRLDLPAVGPAIYLIILIIFNDNYCLYLMVEVLDYTGKLIKSSLACYYFISFWAI